MVARVREHQTVMIAASLAYYAMLSIFPAVIAAVSVYGLVLDPAAVQRQITSLTEALPDDAAALIGRQLQSIVDASATGLGFATAVGILLALYTASAGTKSLITGINIAYGERETRPFLALRGIALLVTLGLVVFAAAAVALVTFLPALLREVGLGSGWERSVTIARWPGIFLLVVLGLGVLYKTAPNRPARRLPFLSRGAIAAAALWMLVTVGLSAYANYVGSFNETYGTLGGVIVLLLWFFLSGLVVLVGAELNDELEEREAVSR
ncbi:MAG: YihY/virulence factor BrkB family protein [Acidimicrobiia bacterium]